MAPRRPSMREVADRAGVALSSVSRVLSNHPDVSPLMRTRVLDAVALLGYEPDLLAQSLRRGPTLTVGFVAGDISNPLVAAIALGAETRMREAGYTMLLTNSFNDPALDARHIRLLWQRRVDGLLLLLADEGHEDTLSALRTTGVAHAFIDRAPARTPQSSAALSDHARGMEAAVEHLLSLGHRRIALVNGNTRVRPARERAAALRRTCRGRGGVAVTVRWGDFGAEHGERATTALLSGREPPTALIAGGNQILVGVLSAIRRLQVRVPSNLSLITCDDVPVARYLEPPVATISRDPGQMGGVAVDLLLEQMRGGEPRTVTLPTEFRATGSCGRPAARA